MLNRKPSIAMVLLLAIIIAGCAGRRSVQEGADMMDNGIGINGDGTISGAEVTGMGTGRATYGQLLPDGTDPLTRRRVHFEFDSATIDEESRIIIEAHSLYLVDNPSIRVVLEGHTDERGTREYNLGLGERRSHAVARLMQALGVNSNRIQSVSYGEERPLSLGSNEDAWALNRRVEIIYGN